VVIDVVRAVSTQEHDYDLPYYYLGQFLQTNGTLKQDPASRHPLGTGQGYEHLWLEAEGTATGSLQFTWMNGERYYTLTSAAGAGARFSLVRIGANDPKINLRNDPGLILHAHGSAQVFASVLEPHGAWDGTREFTTGGFPSIKSVEVLAATDDGTVVKIAGEGGLAWTLCISNRTDGVAAHRVEANGQVYTWDGNAILRRN
jgi:hypothetical protein